jgi:hypothetical protein
MGGFVLLRRFGLVLAFCLVSVSSALAQNWSFDARSVALGAVSGKDNLASRMVEEHRRYRTIVIPLGLFQVLSDLDRFKPESEEFDFVRAIEYAASPLHYQFGRDQESASGRELFTDIRSATLSRDLSDYRGYKLSNQPVAEGLASPSWGATIRVTGDRGGPFQGVYVGAGPYLSMRAAGTIDQRVIDILASEDPLRFPNTQYPLASDTQGQIAMAITGGYRGRFEIANPGSDRDGIYTAVDFNYLHGFRYEAAAANLRLDTDSEGRLTINPLLPSPLVISRTAAESGRGFAIDFGIAAVVHGFEVGFGVNGIANRINWTDAEQTTYLLGNLFLGQDFVESGPFAASDVRVELPKDYHVNGGYHADSWSVMSEYAHGFQGDSLRGGAEYRAGLVELRGGGVYAREMWNPTGGVGLNLAPRVGLDVALYSTAANAARERRAAVAVSLRINAR